MNSRFIGSVLAVSIVLTSAVAGARGSLAADANAKPADAATSLQRSHERFAKSMGAFMRRWMEAGQQWSKATAEMATKMQNACVQCHAVKEQYYQEMAKNWSRQMEHYMKHMSEQLKKVDAETAKALKQKN